METNQPPQTGAPLEPHSSYRAAYFVVGVIAIIVLLAIAVPYTFNIFKRGNQSAADKKLVAADTQTLNTYLDSTSAEAQKAYVASADQRLADTTISDNARNLILLRKAAILGTTRGTPEENAANAAAATKIFKDLINKQNPDTSGLYYRDFGIVALTKLQLQCCTIASDVIDSNPLFSTYSQYSQGGYSKALSALLTLDDMTAQMSQARKGDVMNKLNSLDIASKILNGYSDQISASTKERLLKELAGGIREFPSLKPLTYTDQAVVTYEGGNKLAIANDWYKSQQPDGKSAAVNAAIDKGYEDASAGIRAAMPYAKDSHGLNEVLFYNQIYYLESIDRRYGAAVDTKKKEATIASLMNIINTEPTVKQIATIYFKGVHDMQMSNPDEAKKFIPFSHFVDQGATHPDVSAFMKTIGL